MLPVALQLIAVASLLALCAERPRVATGWWGRRWAIPPLALALSLVLSGSGHMVRKWLARLAMPSGWLLLALLGAACWCWWRQRRREAAVVTAVFVIDAVAGNTWFTKALIRRLEAGYVAPRPGDEPFDAVVLLGGGTGMTPDLRPQLSTSGDRLVVAARLYHQGLTPRILCTDSTIPGLNAPADRALGEDTRALLRDMGVPDEAIVELHGPRTTSEELHALGERLPAEGWRRVGLLTSAWHLPRAMRSSERAGLSLVPIPADFRSTPTMVNIVHLLPSMEGYGNLRLFVWETLGMAMGR